MVLDAQNLEVLKMDLRILVVQTAFIGDAILTLPMIQQLSKNYPGCTIDVVSILSTKEIFLSSPVVNKVFVLLKRKEHKSLLSTIKFALELKKNSYDKIISPHRSFRSSLLVFFADGKESIGYSNSSLGFVYNRKVTYCKTCHEVERNLKLIGTDTSDGGWNILPKIFIDEKEKNKISGIVNSFRNNKIVAIAPGSVWETKIYPKKYYVKIIKMLAEREIQSVLIGGKDDIDLCSEIKNLSDTNCLSLAGELSIAQTVELLRNCSILISNDSAPTHMGMAADIPTVTLFCSTVHAFGFYPYNQKSISLSYDKLECKPCGIHGHKECPIGTFECGKKLLPEDVINSVQSLMSPF